MAILRLIIEYEYGEIVYQRCSTVLTPYMVVGYEASGRNNTIKYLCRGENDYVTFLEEEITRDKPIF